MAGEWQDVPGQQPAFPGSKFAGDPTGEIEAIADPAKREEARSAFIASQAAPAAPTPAAGAATPVPTGAVVAGAAPTSETPVAGPAEEAGWSDVPGATEPAPPGFFGRAAKTVLEAGKAAVQHPLQVLPGAAEAIAGGVGGVAGAAVGGVAGLARGAFEAATGGRFQEGFQRAKGAVEEAFSKIPLGPETEVGKKLTDVLGLIPGAIHAAGETVFEKATPMFAGTPFEQTGAALAAAGTEGLATLLTLKPSIASKTLNWAYKATKNPNAPAVKQAFDDLVRTDPEKATDLKDHVDDPALKKELDRRIKEITVGEKKQVTEIFKRAKVAGVSGEATVQNIFDRAKAEGLRKEQADTAAGVPGVVPAELVRGAGEIRAAAAAAHAAESYELAPPAPREGPGYSDWLRAIRKPGFERTALDKLTIRRYEQGLKAMPERGQDIVYFHAGIPVTRADLARAFSLGRELLRKAPIYATIEREVRTSVDQAIRNIAPEALGPQAKTAAAVIGKNMAVRMQRDSSEYTKSLPRREFWNTIPDTARENFIDRFEQGERFADPTVQRAAEGYRQWNESIASRDASLGLKYEPRDNYLYHTFADSEGVARFFQQRFGPKWNDPRFIKERGFELYKQARAAGFEPRYTNPEDIMLARQHASDVAEMQIQSLNDLETWGLAERVQKGVPQPIESVQWRSPNGTRYWVHGQAAQILQNAFNTKSLWTMPGVLGSGFRGAMWMKNAIVPIKLAVSLFHPLHVQTIDNATAMVRASKELLSGTMSPQRWIAEMGKATVYTGILSNPKTGYRVLNVWRGRIPEEQLTATDRLSLQFLTEGGMVPEMSAQYKNRSVEAFRDALQRRSLTTVFHVPGAMIQAMQKPVFEVWIPSLKAASYLKDVQTALRTDPSLLQDTPRRLEAFRRLSKSVENRYGEMAYNQLFWNRWIKDLGVASTLSMGWNLGFLREYGGALGDIAKATARPVKETAARGGLDRPLFVGFYTAQALAYGGLMTYFFTGQPPTALLDYIFPKTGDKQPDGADKRVNTMFYTREFASIYKHMENEGVVSGLGRLAANKATPLLDMAHTFLSNVNYLGQEISDPNAPAHVRLQQKLAYEFKDMLPISLQTIQKGGGTAKDVALGIAGFSPAPRYVTETAVEGEIKSLYRKYNPRVTPFEKLEYGKDVGKLREAWQARDAEKYSEALLKIKQDYKLTSQQIALLKRNIKTDPTVRMFGQLPAKDQARLLRSMDEDTRRKYLRRAKKHVRVEVMQEESAAK